MPKETRQGGQGGIAEVGTCAVAGDAEEDAPAADQAANAGRRPPAGPPAPLGPSAAAPNLCDASVSFNLPGPQRTSVLAIIGSTGAGKTRLAIELALALNGEVINADAMQIYSGLEVTTSQPTLEERAGVPHHLMGSHGPEQPPLSIVQFRDAARAAISGAASRGRPAIVVGGTLYYVQALLSAMALDESLAEEGAGGEAGAEAEGPLRGPGADADDAAVEAAAAEAEAAAGRDGTPGRAMAEAGGADPVPASPLSAAGLALQALAQREPLAGAHARLAAVDPAAAARLHPNDLRRAARYLEVHRATGRLPSAIFRAQQAQRGGGAGPLKYRALFLWPDAEPAALAAGLRRRAEGMLRGGLLEEVRALLRPRDLVGGAAGGGGSDVGGGSNGLALADVRPAARVSTLPSDAAQTAEAWAEAEDPYAADDPTLHGPFSRGLRQAIGVREVAPLLEGLAGETDEGEASPRAAVAAVRAGVPSALAARLPAGALAAVLGRISGSTLALAKQQRKRCLVLQRRFGWKVQRLDATPTHAAADAAAAGDAAAMPAASAADICWARDVRGPALELARAFLAGGPEGDVLAADGAGGVPDAGAAAEADSLWQARTCEACGGKLLRGRSEWEQHCASRAHRRRSKKRPHSPLAATVNVE